MNIDTEKYILDISTPEDSVLEELYRKTYTSVLNPHMVSGHIQGKFLEMITRMIKPHLVLEIGTYTGYSAISIARGLPDNGKIHSIDINDELADISREYVRKAKLQESIILHTGNALEIMSSLGLTFDLVFIDGDKRQYTEYYEKSVEILNREGYIIADNVLWDGKVIDHSRSDPMTDGIRRFNETVRDDPRTEQIIMPARDGLMLIRKL